MKNVLILALLGFLAACTTPFSQSLKPHPPEKKDGGNRQQFVVAVEQYFAEGRIDSLQQLQRSAGDSVWKEYAEKMLQCAEERNVVQLEKDQRQQMESELAELKQQNGQLSEQIEQLKKLLIEFERRAQ